jgi:NitT/TauT family transport system substrate-binding protein
MWELVAARDINTVAGLKGKVMGVSARGSSDEKSALLLFEQAGLDPERDVTVALVPAGQQLQSLSAGIVQAVMLNADEAAHAERQGFRVLKNVRDMYQVMPYATSGFATADETLQRRPDLVKAWVRANLKTLQYMRDDPRGTTEIAVKVLGLEPEVAEAAIPKAVQGISTDDMGGITERGAQLEIEQNLALTEGQATARQADQLIDLRPLRQVQQELGLPCRGGYGCR